MKVIDLDINDWQSLVNKFKASGQDKKQGKPIALRCENSQLSIARFFGGAILDGERYTFFAPPIPGETNEDGTPKCAWILVRDDFLRWTVKEVKAK